MLDGIIGNLRALAIALFTDREQQLFAVHWHGADHAVALRQLNAAHAAGRTAHHTHFRFGKADGAAIAAGQDDGFRAVCMEYADQLIAFAQTDHAQAAAADFPDGIHVHTLHGAQLCHKEEVMAALGEILGLLDLRHKLGFRLVPIHFNGQDRRHLFVLLQLQQVDHVRALCIAGGQRNLIAFQAECAALVREEQQYIMRHGDEHGGNQILLARCHAGNAASAAPLGAVRRSRHSFDIAQARGGIHAQFVFDQIFDIQFVVRVLNLRHTRCAVFLADFQQFVLQNTADQCRIGQKALKIADFLLDFVIFLL